MSLDINECETDANNCDGNATCSNFGGGFNCTCNDGYKGDGTFCEGKFWTNYINMLSALKKIEAFFKKTMY